MSDPSLPFIAYRDRLLPLSETFIPRQYRGFRTLQPLWLGATVDDGRSLIEGEITAIGGTNPVDRIRRVLFKQLGVIPAEIAGLAAHHPALIHANFGRGGALALPIARHLNLPLVVTFHGGDATKDKHYRRDSPFAPVYQRRLSALIDRAAMFVCVSDFIRRTLLRRGFPDAKLVVNPYGIDIPTVTAAPIGRERPYILFVGRLVEKKGLPYLFEAMAALRRHHPDLALVIVGDGPLRQSLMPHADAAGAVFEGWRSPAEVRAFMAGAVAVAAPSVTAADGDSEGLPNTVLEAMAQGRPVVGSDHAGIGEAIIAGESGILCPERDVGALLAGLTVLVENPDLAARIGQAARARVAAEFDAERQSRKLETILLDAAGIR